MGEEAGTDKSVDEQALGGSLCPIMLSDGTRWVNFKKYYWLLSLMSNQSMDKGSIMTLLYKSVVFVPLIFTYNDML